MIREADRGQVAEPGMPDELEQGLLRAARDRRSSEDRARRRMLTLGLAILICATGSLLSVAAWKALRAADQRDLASSMETTAADLALLIESASNRALTQLGEQGAAWSRLGTDDPELWDAEAKVFLAGSEEFVALEWDPNLPGGKKPSSVGSVEGTQALAARRVDEEARAARAKAIAAGVPACLGLVDIPDGSRALEILIPVPHGPDHAMALTGLMKPTMLLDRLLSQRADKFAVDVSVAGASLYKRGESEGAPPEPFVEKSFTPRHGAEWQLRVRPGPAALVGPRSQLGWAVLFGGIAISALLSSMLWTGYMASTRARDLLGANVELSGRVRELERADEQMRRLDERNASLHREREELTKRVVALRTDLDVRAGHADELEAFTYSASHDLRSPMGAILNYAAVLADDYADQLGPDGRDHVARITASARSAIAMMDCLLAFSRVGRHELRFAELDVRELVKEVFEELRQSQPPEKRLELCMGEVPEVQGDPMLMRILFTNLLSNAFKFTRKDANSQVNVGGYVEGDLVTYYVEDNGVGFDMHQAAKLFRVFERLHSREEYGGHGVGLAIVDRIARRHGGSVRAEAALGKGATFFVTLPRKPDGESS